MGRPTFLFALCLGARSLSILLGNGPSYVQWLVLARLCVRWVDAGEDKPLYTRDASARMEALSETVLDFLTVPLLNCTR